MVKRKVAIRKSVAYRISEIAWYIESKGLPATAIKFSESVYNFIDREADMRKTHRLCSDSKRASLGLKCILFRKKYTLVVIENEAEFIACEFIPSKLIH